MNKNQTRICNKRVEVEKRGRRIDNLGKGNREREREREERPCYIRAFK